MDGDAPDNWKATETLLIALTDELEAALEMSSHKDAETQFAEIAERCRKAAVLAEAGQWLAARRT